MKKKGQITIFIIISLVLIGGVALFLVVNSHQKPNLKIGGETNANAFLQSCLEESTRNIINKIMIQGGEINPKFSTRFKFYDEDYHNISYLCYQQNYYLRCINQHPVLLEEIRKEIKRNIESDVNNCFDELEKELKKNWDVVDVKNQGFDIDFNSNYLIIKFNSEISLTNKKESIKLKNMRVLISTKLQEIVRVVNEIVSQESKYCYFNKLGYMLTYPEWKISEFTTEKGIKIYTVQNKKTQEKFRFAIRTCIIPPGL